ncbi:MAG TPA: iron-sulfur cluster insertion protein ErpA [Candidatus Krumholzibacteria bacterium]|jgi:iron-sulfur cluster assembly accessory protein|nr:iron-sulfur cluster insertion protein ErpA [Candidatus Krumholzibacteria bacterium]
MITLTERAVGRIKNILQSEPEAQGKALRLFVQGGGCAGFQYTFGFDDKHDEDAVVAQDDVEVIIDPMSAVYLAGLQVDYTESLTGAGFRFSNPNATGSCGCGKSFSV